MVQRAGEAAMNARVDVGGKAGEQRPKRKSVELKRKFPATCSWDSADEANLSDTDVVGCTSIENVYIEMG